MLGKLYTWLTEHPKRKDLHGWRRFIVEFWFFGLKEARACLFAGLFFIAMFLVPKTGWLGISRYDLLLIFAISVQAAMLYFKLETWDEVKSITLFHLVGFALEWFKTSGDIQSWSYPDEAYTKIGGVPLCLQALCMLQSAAISFKHGGCLTSKSKATRRIGWALCAHWRFISIFSPITISATIAGILQLLLSDYTRGQRSYTRPMTSLAKCRSCSLSS